jgi:signal transduction histidine kinase
MEEIDTELELLAHYSLRTGIGAIGYRSAIHDSPDSLEWLHIELKEEAPIDQIVLVPAIWRDTKKGFSADGFPREFRLLVGSGQTTNLTVSFGEADEVLPRIAPLVVPFKTTASWVRLEASILSPRSFDGKYNLELAELMVFSGEENVALQQTVETPPPAREEGGARQKRYLVDGFVPYLMNAATGEQSLAMVSNIGIGEHPSLTIDLGAPYPLHRLHLHAVDLSDTIPQSTPSDFGIPPRFIVEGANHIDFTDAKTLVDFRMNSIYEIGPILARRFSRTTCRYVRLTAIEPYIYHGPFESGSRIGFAEIELFSGSRNVALGKAATANFSLNNPGRSLSALTDGLNLYGKILPARLWMEELARRHDLETERPKIREALDRGYARQKANLRRMVWLATLLVAGIAFAILIERMVHMHQLTRLKERFAADLHDELGANLHSIGLLSDLAEETKDDPEDLSGFLHRIRTVTERTGTAVRHIADMQEANGLFTGLMKDMERAAERIVTNLEHEIVIEGEEYFKRLNARKQMDLFLFYKECLINICRHSDATHLNTRLTADNRKIHLSIRDDGRGIEGPMGNAPPPSLKRRARLLGAEVTAEHPASGGTCINLTYRTRRFGFWKS